jgi:hypothetical protein
MYRIEIPTRVASVPSQRLRESRLPSSAQCFSKVVNLITLEKHGDKLSMVTSVTNKFVKMLILHLEDGEKVANCQSKKVTKNGATVKYNHELRKR